MPFEPTSQLSRQPGSLVLQVSIRTPGNTEMEIHQWPWLEVYVDDQFADGR